MARSFVTAGLELSRAPFALCACSAAPPCPRPPWLNDAALCSCACRAAPPYPRPPWLNDAALCSCACSAAPPCPRPPWLNDAALCSCACSAAPPCPRPPPLTPRPIKRPLLAREPSGCLSRLGGRITMPRPCSAAHLASSSRPESWSWAAMCRPKRRD